MWHQVSGGSRGRAWPGPPLFLDQTEAWRTDKTFFLRLGPPLISGSGWLSPPPLSEGLDLPLQVTMVAKFLELNNLSWQRQPFALSNDGKDSRATVWFLSAIMLIPVIFFFFLPYQGLLRSNVVMWCNDVSTIVDSNYPNLLCWTSPRWHAECNGKQKNLTMKQMIAEVNTHKK